ncbi:MAG: CBASS cGAMP synthase [Gammaproteobacteria bacterium]
MGAASRLFYSTDAEQETLNKRVRPSDDQMNLLRQRKDELEAHIKSDISARSDVAVSTWLQGSYKLHTLIRLLSKQDYDVDVGVYFEWGSGSTTKLMSDELRDVLQLSLQGFAENNEHVKRVEDPAKERCSRAYYENHLHIDLPGYHYSTDTGVTRLATLAGKWEKSDPEKMVEWFQARLEGEERAQTRRVVRYLKAWAALRFQDDRDAQPSSLMLTVLATDAFVDVALGKDLDDDDALKVVIDSVFARLSEGSVVENPVESDQDRNLNRLDDAEFGRFMKALRQLSVIARNATQADNTEAEAAASWTEAYDYLLPLPDVEGMVEEADPSRAMVLFAAPAISIEVFPQKGGPPRTTFTGQVDLAYKDEWLRFRITNRHMLPQDAQIRWVVRNVGQDAYAENDIGHSSLDNGSYHDEYAKYHGRHFMDCEVRIGGRLHALTRVPVAITRMSLAPRHPPRRPAYTQFRRRRR